VPPSDMAKGERGARAGWTLVLMKAHGARQRALMGWECRSRPKYEPGPVIRARAGEKPALRRHVIGAGVVEHDNCFGFPRRYPQIARIARRLPSPSSANVADEKNGALGLRWRELHGTRQRPRARHPLPLRRFLGRPCGLPSR